MKESKTKIGEETRAPGSFLKWQALSWSSLLGECQQDYAGMRPGLSEQESGVMSAQRPWPQTLHSCARSLLPSSAQLAPLTSECR